MDHFAHHLTSPNAQASCLMHIDHPISGAFIRRLRSSWLAQAANLCCNNRIAQKKKSRKPRLLIHLITPVSYLSALIQTQMENRNQCKCYDMLCVLENSQSNVYMIQCFGYEPVQISSPLVCNVCFLSELPSNTKPNCLNQHLFHYLANCPNCYPQDRFCNFPDSMWHANPEGDTCKGEGCFARRHHDRSFSK